MEFELIKSVVDLGLSGVALIMLGVILYKVNKSLTELVRSDQESREKNTAALTKLESSIDDFNRINGTNQKDCNVIREAYGGLAKEFAGMFHDLKEEIFRYQKRGD